MHENMADINLDEISVRALSLGTLQELCPKLDEHKILPSWNHRKLPRDYRGLAHLMDISLMQESLGENPTETLLTKFGQQKRLNLGRLLFYLEEIDRFDVLDDTRQMIYDDAKAFEIAARNSIQREPQLNHAEDGNAEILTIDDVIRHQKGIKGPQTYDVCILYVEEDREMAKKLREKIEKDFGLKAFDKSRDLLLGFPLEPIQVMKIIAERSNFVLAVFSEEFVKDAQHTFYSDYAHCVGNVLRRDRIIIPLIYKPCTLPSQYLCYTRAYYIEGDANVTFWNLLRRSLKLEMGRFESRNDFESDSNSDSKKKKSGSHFELNRIESHRCRSLFRLRFNKFLTIDSTRNIENFAVLYSQNFIDALKKTTPTDKINHSKRLTDASKIFDGSVVN